MVVIYAVKEVPVLCKCIEYTALSHPPVIVVHPFVHYEVRKIGTIVTVWLRKLDIFDGTELELFICTKINRATNKVRRLLEGVTQRRQLRVFIRLRI
jgi:hypothetical protein